MKKPWELTASEMGDAIDITKDRKYHNSDGSITSTLDVEPVARAAQKKLIRWLDKYRRFHNDHFERALKEIEVKA